MSPYLRLNYRINKFIGIYGDFIIIQCLKLLINILLKEAQIKKIKYIYYILDENILLEHKTIINKFNNSDIFVDFI